MTNHPTGAPTDDLTICHRVVDGLARTLGPEAAGVGVIVERGVVRLAGFLHEIASRQLAQLAAHAVPGVRAVVDDLAVRDPSFPGRHDGAVAHAAAEALRSSPSVPRDAIQLTMYKGNVTLRGSVVDAHQAEVAEAVVRRVPGVRSVCRDCSVTEFEARDLERAPVMRRTAESRDTGGAQAW